MQPDKLIAQIRRLVLADRAFEQCLELNSYMIEKSGEIEHETSAVCMFSGVCVTYCKNFIESDGNGRLPESYCRFDSPILKVTHDDIMESRNTIYAHRDLLRDNDFKKSNFPNQQLALVEITFEVSGLKVVTQECHFNLGRLAAVESLLRFQRHRIQDDIANKIIALADGKKYALGTYILGETFP